MSERVVLITGGSRGIGRATAIEAGRRGMSVAIVGRTDLDLRGVALESNDARVIVADVARPEAATAIVADVIHRFGRLDALVNNAGQVARAEIESLDDVTWDALLTVNLTAAFRLARAAWPHLRESRGAIVNLSSESTRDPFPGFAAYAAAKAGVEGLSLALAREGTKDSIRVHCIAPGSTETSMLRSIADESIVPRDQTLRPEDVAKVILDCIDGPLRHTSDEVIRLRKST